MGPLKLLVGFINCQQTLSWPSYVVPQDVLAFKRFAVEYKENTHVG